MQGLAAHLGRLSCGDDHSGVGHGQSDARDDVKEVLVGNGIGEGAWVDIVGGTDARHTDGVRSHAETGLEMFGVHQHSHEVVGVGRQTEEYATAHIVDASCLCAVHGLGMPGVVALGPRRVQALIVLLVVSFLKQNVGTNAGLLQFLVVFHRRGGNVHVHSTNGAMLVVGGVNGVDAVENIFNRCLNGMLARLQGKPLVAQVLQG